MRVKKKTRMLSLFLSVLLLISVLSAAAIVQAEVDRDIVLVSLDSHSDLRTLQSMGIEIIEVYPNRALVGVTDVHRNTLLGAGFSYNELPGRTEIRLKNHQFDINQGYPEFDPVLMIDGYDAGVYGLHIIHMLGPVHPEWRSTLQSMGVEIINYAPNYAFEVRMTPELASQVEDLYFVDWVGIYQPGFKLERDVGPGLISLSLLPGVSLETLEAIDDVAHVLSYNVRPFGSAMLLHVDDHASLMELAVLNEVYHVGRYVEPILHDEMASQIIGGGLWLLDDDNDPDTPYRAYGDYGAHVNQLLGVSGEGVVIAVADTGLGNSTVGNAGHEDFTGRVIGGFGFGDDPDYWGDGHGHGTHCTGSAAGDTYRGTEENMTFAPYYKGQGLAYASELYAVKIFSDAAQWIAGNDYYEIVEISKQDADAYVHTNSWGSSIGGTYPRSSAEFDMAVRDADRNTTGNQPMVITTSAGNDGPGDITIGAPATAKNVITVGASHNYNPDSGVTNPDMIVGFSSRGWTVDNRVKPDIVAPGHGITSTMPDGGYATMSGTSMSNPAVAGAAAVVVEWYETLYGVRPSPAMVKAMLINTAHDMCDDGGNTGPIPNRDEGWGIVNLPALMDAPVGYMYVDESELITTGEEHEYHLTWEDDLQPLKISLVWTDKPGQAGDTWTLKNNLDLEVISPDGITVYRGNAFPVDDNNVSIRSFTEANTGAMPEFDQTGDGWDDVNNVLNVYIHHDDLMPGVYTVKVHGTNVPEDANNDGDANQDYALFMSNAIDPDGLPVIEVTYPVGGETWNNDDEVDITWDVTSGDHDTDNIDIQFTMDDGRTWDNIAIGIADTGTYTWTVPDSPTKAARIRAVVHDIEGVSRPHTSREFDIIGTPPGAPTNLGVDTHMGETSIVVDDFQDGDYTRNPEWTVFSGDWSVGQQDGTRWLEGIGSISTPSTQAYGRWEWDFQFVNIDGAGGAIQAMRFFFVQDTPDPASPDFSGYYFIVTGDIGGDAVINLWRFDNGTNPDSPIFSVSWPANTDWNTVAIERDLDGVFTLYLNDHFLATGQDNTYTTSSYIGFRHTVPAHADRHRVSEIRTTVELEGDLHNLIEWNRSADDGIGRNSVAHYSIQRSMSDSGPWYSVGSVKADGSASYMFRDLYAGSHDNIYWWYRVRAVDIHDLYDTVAMAPMQEPIPLETTLEIISPVDGQRFNTDSVAVHWRSTGPIEYYYVYLNDEEPVYKLERNHNFINLPYGAYEVRVEAIGDTIVSDTVSFIVDTSATHLEITSESGGITFDDTFIIQGATEPSALVEINDVTVHVDPDTGIFQHTEILVDGLNAFHVVATGESGISSTATVYALYMPDIPILYDEIDGIHGLIGGLGNQIDNLRSDISAVQSALASAVANLESQIATLEEDMLHEMDLLGEDLYAAISDLEAQIDELESDLNTEVADLRSHIDTLSSQIAALTSDLSDVWDEIDSHQDQIDGLDSNIDALESEVDELESELENLTTQLGSLNEELESLEGSLGNDISDLRTQIQRLESVQEDQDDDISSAATMVMLALVLGILALLIAIVAVVMKGKRSGPGDAVAEAHVFEQDLDDEPLFSDEDDISDDDIF